MSEDSIKSINKTIVHENGKIDSFDKQLINLSGGIFDVRFPLVVSDNTNCLSYISTINESKPLTMMVSTAIKIREKHDIGFAYVSQVNDLLKNSIMAFESLKHATSVIVLLDDYDDIDDPMIAVCRTDKKVGYVDVNEITSIYDRELSHRCCNVPMIATVLFLSIIKKKQSKSSIHSNSKCWMI